MLIKFTRALLYKIFNKYQSMKRQALKDQLYGGILEMTKNRTLFNKSDIGKEHRYSDWTSAGEKELLEFIKQMTTNMLVSEDAEIDARAKDMVFNKLKEKS